MSILSNKIDFAVLVSVTMANPNGDPLDGNRPRTSYSGYGEISDVCIKRKLRNRMQDMGQRIFVQSDDRSDDGCKSLRERANAVLGKTKDRDEYARIACETWMGVRGPVSIHQAVSLSPVEVKSLQITKSVNGEPGEKRSSDTMGSKHIVRFGLYLVKGSINVQLAQKTGFTNEDAGIVRECLRTLFENDASSARPDGSMEVCRLYWWEHNCPCGQYSSAKVHRSLHVALKTGVEQPDSFEDYDVTLDTLPGLACEIIDGV